MAIVPGFKARLKCKNAGEPYPEDIFGDKQGHCKAARATRAGMPQFCSLIHSGCTGDSAVGKAL